MRDTELYKLLLIIGIGMAAIIARYFWAKYRAEKPKPDLQPMPLKASTVAFIFGMIAVLAILGKPSTFAIANSAMLAVVAVIFVFAISEKIQGR